MVNNTPMNEYKTPLPGFGKPCGSSLISYSPSPKSYAKSQGCSVDITSLSCLTVKYKGAKEFANVAKAGPPGLCQYPYCH